MRTNKRLNLSSTVLGVGVFGALFICVTAFLLAVASRGSILGVLTGIVVLTFILMIGGQLLVDALLRRRHRIEKKVQSVRQRLRK
ncbi:MAG: putative membrane protein [Natronomonas sp.]|jgi:uncharacterized membrane protein